jgi:hypothetical protein
MTVVAGVSALKTAFDTLRSAIGLVKDAKSLLPAGDSRETAISLALESATASAKVAEAQMAQAFGYELCKCQLPPTPMLTVGSIENREAKKFGAVYECPKCGFNTAGPWNYTRIAAPRPDNPPA